MKSWPDQLMEIWPWLLVAFPTCMEVWPRLLVAWPLLQWPRHASHGRAAPASHGQPGHGHAAKGNVQATQRQGQ